MADAAYGLWPLVVLNTLLFIVFAASFFHPKSKRDWWAMGAYSAFLVALFTEMYGTPLTARERTMSGPDMRGTHAGGPGPTRAPHHAAAGPLRPPAVRRVGGAVRRPAARSHGWAASGGGVLR